MMQEPCNEALVRETVGMRQECDDPRPLKGLHRMIQRPCHRADGGLRQECKDPRLLQWSAWEGAETLPLRLSMLLAPGEVLGGL